VRKKGVGVSLSSLNDFIILRGHMFRSKISSLNRAQKNTPKEEEKNYGHLIKFNSYQTFLINVDEKLMVCLPFK
jgi:hypothetical protein